MATTTTFTHPVKSLHVVLITAACLCMLLPKSWAGVSPVRRTHPPTSSLAPPAYASDPLLTPTLVPNNALRTAIRDRVQVGIRISHKSLLDPSAESFIGSVNELSERQHYLPPQLFISVLINDYFGIELSYDQIEAETITTEDGHTDGYLNLRGPTLQFFGNCPFILHAGPQPTYMSVRACMGIAILRGTFEDEPWWHHGFPAPPDDPQQLYADWIAAGAPEWPNAGLKRHMSVEDEITWFLAASLQARFYDRLSAELRLQFMQLQTDASVDLTFRAEPYQQRHGSFDLDSLSIGLGVLYTF
jgi:hypothetical protein